MPLIEKVIKVESMALVESDCLGLLKEKLTLTSTGHNPFTLQLYKEADLHNQLWIPRNLVAKSGVSVERNPKWYSDFNTSIVLKDEQKTIVDTYLRATGSHSPYGGTIQANTGSGKTVMAIYLASKLQLKTLIIVPSNTLLSQWKERIAQFTDCTEADIGVIQQDRCEVEDKKIVLAMLHSLAMRNYPDWIYSNFGFVVADELHRLAAEVLSRAIFKFNSVHTCGLSATPDRKDGLANVFLWSLGSIVAKSSKKDYVTTIFAVPYDNIDTHHKDCIGKYGKFRGKLISSKYLNKLELSKPRIIFTGKILQKLYNNGENVLLLSDRISLLENLKRYLLSVGINESDIGLFCGKYKETGRKIELATYGCAGEGYDRVDIDSVVLLTPRVDIRQAIGRLRKAGKVIDIVDMRSDIMQGWYYGRVKHYTNLGCKIINKLKG